MSSSILSVYYSPWHWRAEDEEYIRRLNPAWVRIHQPTARAIELVQRNAPNAKVLLRSWDIDDSNGDRKRELYADPKGAARNHLAMWRAKWDELEAELKRNGWQYNVNRWYMGLVNEPDPAYVPQVVEYSLEAMRLVQGTQIRLGLVCSSVGNFSKPSENDRGWTKFVPLEKPINDGGHILVAHEYWQPEGPNFGEDGGNLAWRHQHIPLDVPILIGESGANGYIYGRYSQNDDSGWQKTVKDPNVYAAQVREYIEGCDQRVQGVCLYMLDYHSDQWWSFDTNPAMRQLLAIRDVKPQKPNPFAKPNKPVETRLPQVSAGPQPAQPPGYVLALSGVNVRAAPNTSSPILDAIPYGEQVRILGVEQDGWLRVRYGQGEGYVAAQYIGLQSPEPLPAPQPTAPAAPQSEQEAFDRVMAFVLRMEGGVSTDPNDPGNYVNGRFVGTKYGISAASYPNVDIVNLTVEQAKEIYRRDYWGPSGASALPWPLCLAVMDLAVNAGVGRAQEALKASGHDFIKYIAWRIAWYTRIDNFDRYGRAWIRRCSELMLEASR